MIFSGVTPISLNAVYATDFRTKRRFKSKAYKEYEGIIREFLRNDYKHYVGAFKQKAPENYYIKMDIRFYMPIFVKSGDRISLTSKDVSNCIKPLEDIIATEYGFNDSLVVNVCASKVHSAEHKIMVDLFICDINTIL